MTSHRVPIIDRMMQIVEHLETAPGGDTLSGVTRALGMPKTTAYRILNTLLDHRMVEQDPSSGTYALGRRLLQLAGRVSRSSDLAAVSRAEMQGLSHRLGEGCKLSVRDGDDALVIAAEQSPRGYGIATGVGRRLPLHAGAASKVLLAHAGEGEIERVIARGLNALTPHTITEPEALRRALATIRVEGWAADDQEYVEGVKAMGAPVLDAFDRVVAALSVPFLATSSEARSLEIREAVIEAAGAISAELGARVPAAARH